METLPSLRIASSASLAAPSGFGQVGVGDVGAIDLRALGLDGVRHGAADAAAGAGDECRCRLPAVRPRTDGKSCEKGPDPFSASARLTSLVQRSLRCRRFTPRARAARRHQLVPRARLRLERGRHRAPRRRRQADRVPALRQQGRAVQGGGAAISPSACWSSSSGGDVRAEPAALRPRLSQARARRAGHRHLPHPGARGAALPRARARPCTPTPPARWCAAWPSSCKQKLDAPRRPRSPPRCCSRMLAGHDRIKRLFAVPPGAESEAARTARIVDLFLKGSPAMKVLASSFSASCSPPAATAAPSRTKRKTPRTAPAAVPVTTLEVALRAVPVTLRGGGAHRGLARGAGARARLRHPRAPALQRGRRGARPARRCSASSARRSRSSCSRRARVLAQESARQRARAAGARAPEERWSIAARSASGSRPGRLLAAADRRRGADRAGARAPGRAQSLLHRGQRADRRHHRPRACSRTAAWCRRTPSRPAHHAHAADPIWVRFSLSEAEFARVRGSESHRGRSSSSPTASTYPHTGKLNFAGSTVDAATGTVQMRAEFPNPKLELLPGQFVTVRVGRRHAARPSSCRRPRCCRTRPARFVWVVDGDGKAAQRPVRAGELARQRLDRARRPEAGRHGHRRQPGAPASRRRRCRSE